MDQARQLTDLISRHAGDGLTATALPGISLLRATAATEPLGEVAEPAVAFIAQGVKETVFNGEAFRHGPGQFAVVPVELPVLAHIRAHYDHALCTDDLAAIATMSVTSFHRHFRALTAMSPGQYQKQLRMYHARARLLADPDDIAAADYAVGYSSPSQFSREYTRTFGLPPSRHAAALRDRAQSWEVP